MSGGQGRQPQVEEAARAIAALVTQLDGKLKEHKEASDASQAALAQLRALERAPTHVTLLREYEAAKQDGGVALPKLTELREAADQEEAAQAAAQAQLQVCQRAPPSHALPAPTAHYTTIVHALTHTHTPCDHVIGRDSQTARGKEAIATV